MDFQRLPGNPAKEGEMNFSNLSRRSFGRHRLLPQPLHNGRLLPVLRVPRAAEKKLGLLRQARREAQNQIVAEFRSKLRLAEDLMSKLNYNLREIQATWNSPTMTAAQLSLHSPLTAQPMIASILPVATGAPASHPALTLVQTSSSHFGK
jgi:hypothetical protein